MALAQWSETYLSIRNRIKALGLSDDAEFQQDVNTLEEFMRSSKTFLLLNEIYEPYVAGRVAIVTDEGTSKTISAESFNAIFQPGSGQSRVTVNAN